VKVYYTKCQKLKTLSILTFSFPLLRSSSERLSLLRSSSRRRSVEEKGQFKRLTFDTELVSQFVRTTMNFFRNQLINHTSKPYSYICRYTITPTTDTMHNQIPLSLRSLSRSRLSDFPAPLPRSRSLSLSLSPPRLESRDRFPSRAPSSSERL